jgi:hypothetical protein
MVIFSYTFLQVLCEALIPELLTPLSGKTGQEKEKRPKKKEEYDSHAPV